MNSSYWNMDKGNNRRTGLYEAGSFCGNIELGDLNCDENIDIFDLILIVNIILDEISPDEMQQWSGDFNQDENIDVSDITAILNMILE